MKNLSLEGWATQWTRCWVFVCSLGQLLLTFALPGKGALTVEMFSKQVEERMEGSQSKDKVQSTKRPLGTEENLPKLHAAVFLPTTLSSITEQDQVQGSLCERKRKTKQNKKKLPTYPTHRIFHLSTDLAATSVIIQFNILILQLCSKATCGVCLLCTIIISVGVKKFLEQVSEWMVLRLSKDKYILSKITTEFWIYQSHFHTVQQTCCQYRYRTRKCSWCEFRLGTGFLPASWRLNKISKLGLTCSPSRNSMHFKSRVPGSQQMKSFIWLEGPSLDEHCALSHSTLESRSWVVKGWPWLKAARLRVLSTLLWLELSRHKYAFPNEIKSKV